MIFFGKGLWGKKIAGGMRFEIMKIFSREVSWKQFCTLLGLCLLLLVPNVALIFQFYSFLTGISIFFMALAILVTPMLFLPLRPALFVQGLFLLLFPLDLSSWVGMQQPITEGFINSIWNSNFEEMSEQLRHFFLPVIVVLVSLVLYFIAVLYGIPRGVWFRVAFRLKVLLPVALLGFFAFSLFGKEDLRPFVVERPWSMPRYHTALKWTFNRTFPFDVIRRVLALNRHLDSVALLNNERNIVWHGGEVQTSIVEGDSIIGVFVIGETSRACNWQLAGYERETNPRLVKQKNLYFFDDAFSGANYTQYSVPMLLSVATPRDMYAWQRTPLITEILSQTPYSQGWVANQSGGEFWLEIALKSCDYKKLLTWELKTWELNNIHDEKLLPIARKFLDSMSMPKMLYMHTMGGHFDYTKRYTKEFAYYKPDLAYFKAEVGEEKDPYWVIREGGKDVPGFVNSFDNTIRYTDMVLDSVITFLEGKHKPAFLIYMADHGENLLEPPEYRTYHSYDDPSHYEAHVPFFVWLSDEYLARYPKADSLLKAHLHLPIHCTVTFHTLLDLTHVRHALYDSTQSLLSPYFVPSEMRPLLNPDKQFNPEPSYPEKGGVCPVYNRRKSVTSQ